MVIPTNLMIHRISDDDESALGTSEAFLSLKTMDGPMWRRQLQSSLSLNKSIQSRWPQLSTLSLDGGRPCTRTIAFRGFLSDVQDVKPSSSSIPNFLVFVTDKRSTKFEEIQANQHVALCWYLPDSREQFRFSCRAYLVPLKNDSTRTESKPLNLDSLQLDKLRRHFWTQLSDKTRAQFAWPAPKSPLDSQSSSPLQTLSLDSPLALEAFKNFTLILLNPYEVDYLNIGVTPNKRTLHWLSEIQDWSYQDVNP